MNEDYEYNYAINKDINICFISGIIITDIEFDFFYNSRKLTSKASFYIETEKGYNSSKNRTIEKIFIVAYNEKADLVYNYLEIGNYILIKGFLEQNRVVVDDIYKETNFSK